MVFYCFEVCITLDRVVTKPVVIHNTLFIDIYISKQSTGKRDYNIAFEKIIQNSVSNLYGNK